MSDQENVEALAQLFWRWHDESGAPLEVRSYLRGLAAWADEKGVRAVAAPLPRKEMGNVYLTQIVAGLIRPHRFGLIGNRAKQDAAQYDGLGPFPLVQPCRCGSRWGVRFATGYRGCGRCGRPVLTGDAA